MRRAGEGWRGLYVGRCKTYLGEDNDFAFDVFECLSRVHCALLVNKIQGRGKKFGLLILEVQIGRFILSKTLHRERADE